MKSKTCVQSEIKVVIRGENVMKHIKRQFIYFLLCLVMVVGIFPANVLALGAGTPTNQIGNHWAADSMTGVLAVTPELTGNTSKSYADGWVLTDKTISAGTNENEFLITLDVRTKAEIENIVFSEDAAAVIVIDLSNSMTEQRLANAKSAALAFAGKFAETENTDAIRKIAIVGFSGAKMKKGGHFDEGNNGITAARTYQAWTNASDASISSAINRMQADGGTCLQAGLILAKNLLNSDEVSGIANKNIIVLTDGKPTYHLSSTAQASTSTAAVGEPDQILGSGSETNHDTHTSTENTAKSILKTGINVYGVYLGADRVQCSNGDSNCKLHEQSKTGVNWLRENCGFITYAASEVDNLSLIFQSISELIELQAKAWIADDPIGEMFAFDGFVNTPADANEYFYNSTDDKVIWNLRMATPVYKTEDGYSIYQLTYKVKLNTLDSGYTEGTYYPANGITSVSYLIEQTTQDETSAIESGTAYFNVPSAKGYAADITFNKVDEQNSPLAGAEFILTTADDSNWSMTATSGSDGVVLFEDVPSGHTYMLKENSAPRDFIKSDTTYTLTISYGELSGSIGTNNTVVNSPEPQNGSLTVSKTVSGSGADSTKDFTFTVDAEIGGEALTGTYGDMAFNNGSAVFTLKAGENKTASNLPAGTEYTVTESDNDGYTVTVNGTRSTIAKGTVAANTNAEAAFNNYKDGGNISDPEYGSLTVSKTVSGSGADSTKDFTFTVDAMLDGEALTGTYGDMAFDNGSAVFTLKAGENKTASNLPAGTEYTVTESDNDGYTVTVNGTSETTAKGKITANNAAIAAFNNYKSGGGGGGGNPDGSIKITKTVTGNNAPTESIDYEFKVWVQNSSGNPVSESVYYKIVEADKKASSGSLTIGTDGYTFKLKDGESITFSSITSGRRIEATEISTGDFNTNTSGLTDGICVISSNTTKAVEFINDYGNTNAGGDPDPVDSDSAEPIPTEPTPTEPANPNRPLDNTPQTGDSVNIDLWLVLTSLSLLGIITLVFERKRYKTQKNR